MPGGLLKGVKDAIEPLCMSGKCCCCCLLLHYTGLIRVFCNVSQANVAQSTSWLPQFCTCFQYRKARLNLRDSGSRFSRPSTCTTSIKVSCRICLHVWYASLVFADIELVDDLSVFFTLLMNTNGTKAAQCSAEHLHLKGERDMNQHVSSAWMLPQRCFRMWCL